MSPCRLAAAALILVVLKVTTTTAQDSSRADWRAWWAAKDSVARCRAFPQLLRVYGRGEYTVHRTPSGGTCQAGPGPWEPTAWIIDSARFCPDSNPHTWGAVPPHAPSLDTMRILDVQFSPDTSLPRLLRCAIRPKTVMIVRTASFGAGTAFMVADTLVLARSGARLTVPAFWMGRIPEGLTVNSPGPGRFGCQLMELRPYTRDRIVTDSQRLTEIDRGTLGAKRTYQDALDAVLPRANLIAHVGGVPFNSSCIAPQLHFYLFSSSLPAPDSLAAVMQRLIEQKYRGVQRALPDSAGWSIIRLSWSENLTHFVHPASVELWSRRVGSSTLVVAVMDAWAAKYDVAALLASIRVVGQPRRAPD